MGVVVAPPILNQDLRFFERVENLPVEELVAHLAVETLDAAVLPRAAFLNEQRTHSQVRKQVSHLRGGELRAVIGAEVGGNGSPRMTELPLSANSRGGITNV